jgi:hypothetical protein
MDTVEVKRLPYKGDKFTWSKYGGNYTPYTLKRGRTAIALRQTDDQHCKRDLTIDSTHRDDTVN